MRNASNKSCRENQNTHFTYNNLFPKILRFLRKCGKTWWSHGGRADDSMAARCVLVQYGYTHASTGQRMCSHTTHAHTHTHIQKYVIITAFPRQQWCLITPQCSVLRTKPVLFSHPTYRTCSLCYYQHHFDDVRIEYMTARNNLMTYLSLSMTEATCFASYQVKAPCILYSTVYMATIFSVNRDRIKMCYVRFVGSISFIMRN